ncbi:hypothetical protein BU16DRAFT_538945 [Lophium mytilinum]|uniref:Uncharacterized protein n=1 Tax=Lophium mytilinum TaxID=390894 RepID=A0A6A6QWC1_9PEZI|nr:hypothetical protein BU16DRAFT_538945 [Lophium mytilinum]
MPRQSKIYRPSRLELLPTELRQHVYSSLGFPILRKVMYESFSWGCPAVGQTILKSVNFHTQEMMALSRAWFDVLYPETGELHTYSVVEHEALPELRAVLCLNTFFAMDVWSLFLNNVEAVFDFPLGNKLWRGWESPFQWNLSPFPFQVMTSITLTDEIGCVSNYTYSYISKPFSELDTFKESHRGRLAKFALSIRYVAQHCPSLRSLTLHPHHHSLNNTKLSALDIIPSTLKELVRKVPRLQSVKMEFLCCQLSEAEESEAHLESEESGDDLLKILLHPIAIPSTFTPYAIPEYLREDAIAAWATDMLRTMRKQECERDEVLVDMRRRECEPGHHRDRGVKCECGHQCEKRESQAYYWIQLRKEEKVAAEGVGEGVKSLLGAEKSDGCEGCYWVRNRLDNIAKSWNGGLVSRLRSILKGL